MWKAVFTAIFMVLFSIVSIPAGEQQGPRLTFATDGYDCGNIDYVDVDVKTIAIEFSNTGDAPLVLANVRACCGTRVTQWPAEPILPGEHGAIEVRFRVPNRPHMINRVVSVQSNSADEPRKQFRITGRANRKPD